MDRNTQESGEMGNPMEMGRRCLKMGISIKGFGEMVLLKEASASLKMGGVMMENGRKENHLDKGQRFGQMAGDMKVSGRMEFQLEKERRSLPKELKSKAFGKERISRKVFILHHNVCLEDYDVKVDGGEDDNRIGLGGGSNNDFNSQYVCQ